MNKKVDRVRLTPGFINELNSKSEEYLVWDLDCPGLAIRVHPIFKNKKGEDRPGRKIFIV